MTEGAFYQQKRTSPTALAIVVMMHGAGLTALALAKSEALGPRRDPPIVVQTIPEQKPPPEAAKPVEKVAEPRQEPAITRTPPIIEMPPMPGPVTTWKDPPTPVIFDPGPVVLPPREPAITPPPEAKKVAPARAKANLASYVSDEDYPSTAVRNEEQGTTRFRLGVGPDGRVKDCTVTGSSGSSALDMATCRLMRQRAKFTPAHDSDGKAMSDSVASAIRWVLPD